MDLSTGLIAQVVTATGDGERIILALVAVVATSVAALAYTIKNNALGKTIAKDASEVNAAVNHTEYGEHRLYDVVKRIEEKQEDFDRKWGNLPSEMGDAVGLVELIHGMDKRIAAIQAQLLEHVAWEMAVKYPKEEP